MNPHVIEALAGRLTLPGRRGACRFATRTPAGTETLRIHLDPASDWTSPGAFEVAPGLFRIPLPLPNDGLRAVNVYALLDDSGVGLIDSGWAIPAARVQLEYALALLGRSIGDIRRIVVTHVHRDHYTQGVALRREFGSRLSLGAGEKPSLELVMRAGHGICLL